MIAFGADYMTNYEKGSDKLAKDAERATIKRETEEFLDSGGEVEMIKNGFHGKDYTVYNMSNDFVSLQQ